MPSLQITQDLPDRGLFRATITSRLGARPIENATVRISNINDPNIVIDEITTDQNGQTDSIELAAPPVEYSLEPNDTQPYSVYNIQVSAPGYETQTSQVQKSYPGRLLYKMSKCFLSKERNPILLSFM